MAKTRSGKAAATSGPASKSKSKDEQPQQEAPVSKSKYTLEPASTNPPHLFVFPEQATKDASIVTLPNPRTSLPARYLVCPETGVYEFTRISAPKTAPTSWLITPTTSGDAGQEGDEIQAVVASSGDMYLATPFDSLFLMLPALAAASEGSRKSDGKRLFLSSEDHFDALPSLASHLGDVLRLDKVKTLIEERMRAACDVVDAGDDKMYRLDEKKLLAELVAKASRMGKDGLPPSMEERFVKKALEAPLLVQKRTMTVVATAEVTSMSGVSTPAHESRSTTVTVETEASETTTVATAVTSATSSVTPTTGDANAPTVSMTASSEVVSLQRLRVAFDFICARYVPPALAQALQDMLADASVSGVDFAPLATYMAELARARAEAHAARSMGGDYTRKHGRDEEADDARAEKKRKADEDKKKKATASRGVKDLQKVDTSGMKKLSSFFTKKPKA